MTLARRCILELIGTYFLALVIATAAVGGMALNLAPLAVAGILVAMIYMAGPHTGAHFNPVVSVAFWVRGTFPADEIIPYVLAQCIGAVLATLTQFVLIENAVPQEQLALGATLANTALGENGGRIADWMQLGVGEIVFTFALVMVILHVASASKQAGNQYFGLAIGFMVMAGAFAVGPVSGAVFNPAVLLGLWILGATSALHALVILMATFVGGLLAAITFRALHQVDTEQT